MRFFRTKLLLTIILPILAFAVFLLFILFPLNPTISSNNYSTLNNNLTNNKEITPISSIAEQITKIPSSKHNSITPISTTSSPQPTNFTPTVTPNSQVLATTSTEKTITASPTMLPTPTSAPKPTSIIYFVNVQIQAPDAASNFSIELKQGMNVCDVLQKAKDEDKIKSLIFDDSYISNYKSRYIYEINGYKNNWTFTVNGNSPLGCSLYTPKANDIIIWKFN